MAFPVVEDADTKNGTVTSNASTWTLTYPTNLVSGDLIFGALAQDAASVGGIVWPAGWVGGGSSFDAGANVGLASKFKISDGTETGDFSVTVNGSEQGGWRVFRITGWFGSDAVNNCAATGGHATSPSANPDPPSLDPAGWATEDTLWFALAAIDTSRTVSVYPLADRNTADTSGGAGGATLAICSTNSAVASLDPGTFTISTSDDWQCFTIAIRPAAVAAVTPDNTLPRYGQAVMRSATR